MENKKTKILTILCVLLSIGFISTAFAYYSASTVKVTNTFVASTSGKLFDSDNPETDFGQSFVLEESEAVIGTNGVYTLTNVKKKANEYKILPGATIPKDPTISIKNKTEIETFLYLEVVDDTKGAISYTIDQNEWKLLSGVTGAKTGKVYVYCPYDETSKTNKTKILGAIGEDPLTVNILHEQKVHVDSENTKLQNGTLTFYAYLAQTGLGDEATTYTTCFIGNN